MRDHGDRAVPGDWEVQQPQRQTLRDGSVERERGIVRPGAVRYYHGQGADSDWPGPAIEELRQAWWDDGGALLGSVLRSRA